MLTNVHRTHQSPSSAGEKEVSTAGSPWVNRLLATAAVVAIGWIALTYSGCDEEGCCFGVDSDPPAVPRGLYSITGDEQVELRWVHNEEIDLSGYGIFRGAESRGYFRRIATVSPNASSFIDRDVSNGTTFWYAITAFDDAGNQSELSPEEVFDTPRPEGFSVRLRNSALAPAFSGYDFSRHRVVDSRDLEADIYFWAGDDEGPWMIATERSNSEMTDLQDAGFMPLPEVDWAPENGWSPRGEAQLIDGHSYLVWTWDNHFAKFRIVSLRDDEVVLDWAYQTDPGNPELFVPAGNNLIVPRTPAASGREHQVGLERRNAK